MKRFELNDGNSLNDIYVGNAREIMSLDNKLRASGYNRSMFTKYDAIHVFALSFHPFDTDGDYSIVDSDTIARWMVSGYIKEVER